MVQIVTVAFGGVFGGLEGRWLVGLGFLFALALIGAFASLAAAFRTYEKELTERTAELDLSNSLVRAEWHDLYSTHDAVPDGRSLVAREPGIRESTRSG